MVNKTKLALFVGGVADGWTKEIGEIEPRLNCYDTAYISRGSLETRALGTVQVYVLENMKSEEEDLRMELIKKSL